MESFHLSYRAEGGRRRQKDRPRPDTYSGAYSGCYSGCYSGRCSEKEAGRDEASVAAVSSTRVRDLSSGSGSFNETEKSTEEVPSCADAAADATYKVLSSLVRTATDVPDGFSPESSSSTEESAEEALVAPTYANARSSNTPETSEVSETCQVRFQPTRAVEGRSSSMRAPSESPEADAPGFVCSS